MSKVKFADRVTLRLNACSLEILHNTQLYCENNEETAVLPLVVGCYQLNESNSKKITNNDNDCNDDGGEDRNVETQESSSSTRSGELVLYMTELKQEANELKFGKPVQVVERSSGVLDGKWYHSRPLLYANHSDEENTNSILEKPSFVYATACSSGQVDVFALQESENTKFKLQHICSSSDTDSGLCLSLAWDESNRKEKGSISVNDDSNKNDEVETRIVSSYSDGTLAVHNVNLLGKDGNCLTETHRWSAHSLFGIPSEVWTVCFASNKNYNTYLDTVISGGDDCKMKLWDLRSCCSSSTPIHTSGRNEFEAGVTAVSYHPSLEHIFASGSYDESLRIWDMRKLQTPLSKIESVGGGVWRIKWHPEDGTKMLIGAMHGGCRLVTVSNLFDSIEPLSLEVVREFTDHESMAYGADWLCNHAAASCSFYDRQAFIWDTE